MSDGDLVIEVEHLTKEYFLGQERSNLRAALPGRWGEPRHSDVFRALDDVSFGVERGEAFGIVGGNGAGKSTLLKVIAGVVRSTSGTVIRPADVVSIIELGLGFDPDLTGMQNLTYGGAFLGMPRVETAAMAPEIIEFAELGGFADMPVKRYSTGMTARLGFALATSIPGDVYLIDEVLSVGDWGFQRKSLQRIKDLQAAGATVLFVSHNLWVVNQLCDRALLLNGGRVEMVGSTSQVLGHYLGLSPAAADVEEKVKRGNPAYSEGQTEVGKDGSGPGEDNDGTDDGLGVILDERRAAVLDLPVDSPGTLDDPDFRPAVIGSLTTDTPEIDPAGPFNIYGTVEVRRPIPGASLVVGAYWEGFAGFSTPDVLYRRCFETPGTYEFSVHFPSVVSCPAKGSFQVAIVGPEEPDDPEQLLPHAIDKRSVGVTVRGPISARPGIWLPREFEIRCSDGSGSADRTTR